MKQQQKLPALRFPEFEDLLIFEKLGLRTTWASGGTPSKKENKYWNGTIPWISASSMRGVYYGSSKLMITNEGLLKGSKLAKKGNLLILVRGSMLFKKIPIGITSKDVAFNQDVKSIVTKNSLGTKYLLYWFLSKEIFLLNIVTGTGIGAGKLDLADLKSLKISLPSLPEQQKIASFLTVIDERLRLLKHKKEQLQQYKKGVMQQLFSQTIRFKQDDGTPYKKWAVGKLSDIATRVKTKNKIDNQNVLTISAQLGLISQLEYFNKSVSAKNLTNYFLIEKNDFAYNKSYSKGYPMGAIKRLNRYDYGVVSTLYICFRFNDKVSLNFMEQYFESGLQNKEIEKVAQEGARNHGLLNIGLNDFFEIDLKLPSLPEQTKIANSLTSIDDQITLVTQQIDQMTTYKKGLLQQMFV